VRPRPRGRRRRSRSSTCGRYSSPCAFSALSAAARSAAPRRRRRRLPALTSLICSSAAVASPPPSLHHAQHRARVIAHTRPRPLGRRARTFTNRRRSAAALVRLRQAIDRLGAEQRTSRLSTSTGPCSSAGEPHPDADRRPQPRRPFRRRPAARPARRRRAAPAQAPGRGVDGHDPPSAAPRSTWPRPDARAVLASLRCLPTALASPRARTRCAAREGAARRFVECSRGAAPAAGRIVVVDSPAGVLSRCWARRRPSWPCSRSPTERAARCGGDRASGCGLASRPAGARAGAQRDVPLARRRAIDGLTQAHERSGAAATMVTCVLDDPSGYGAWCAMTRARCCAWWRRRAGGRRHGRRQLQISEVTRASTPSTPRRCAPAARLKRRERAGRSCTCRRCSTCCAPTAARSRATCGGSDGDAGRQRSRRAGAGAASWAGGDPPRAHAWPAWTSSNPTATVIDVDVRSARTRRSSRSPRSRAARASAPAARSSTSYLIDCLLEDGVSVGPFAYLRRMRRCARARRRDVRGGQDSDIGAAAKVPPCPYIGDADVGEGTNLGAGTITANYDGQPSTARRSASACTAASTRRSWRR